MLNSDTNIINEELRVGIYSVKTKKVCFIKKQTSFVFCWFSLVAFSFFFCPVKEDAC